MIVGEGETPVETQTPAETLKSAADLFERRSRDYAEARDTLNKVAEQLDQERANFYRAKDAYEKHIAEINAVTSDGIDGREAAAAKHGAQALQAHQPAGDFRNG